MLAREANVYRCFDGVQFSKTTGLLEVNLGSLAYLCEFFLVGRLLRFLKMIMTLRAELWTYDAFFRVLLF